MKSLKLRLSNGVPTITFRLLVPKIQKAKNLGFGSQIPYDLTHLGGQGRRGESYIFGKLRSFSKKFSKIFFHTTLCESFLPNGVSVADAKNEPAHWLGTPENRP